MAAAQNDLIIEPDLVSPVSNTNRWFPNMEDALTDLKETARQPKFTLLDQKLVEIAFAANTRAGKPPIRDALGKFPSDPP